MILETLLPQLEFQSNIEDAVKQKMIKSRRQVEEIAATAYSSNDFDFLLCKRMPLTRLVVVVYLLTQKYAEYKAIGVTDEIILDTFSDVSLRANLLSIAVLPEKVSCLVVASCVSLVSPQAAKLTRSAAPPLPTKPCGFAGAPTIAAYSGVGTLPAASRRFVPK